MQIDKSDFDYFRSQLMNGSLYISSIVEDQGLTGNYQCMASLPTVGSIVSRTAKLSLASKYFCVHPHEARVSLTSSDGPLCQNSYKIPFCRKLCLVKYYNWQAFGEGGLLKSVVADHQKTVWKCFS